MAYGDTCGKWKMCFPKSLEELCSEAITGSSVTVTIDWTSFQTQESKTISGGTIANPNTTGLVSATWTGSNTLTCPVLVQGVRADYQTSSNSSIPTTATQQIPGSLWTGQFSITGGYYSRFYSVEYFRVLCSGVTGNDWIDKYIKIYPYEAFHSTPTPPAASSFTLITPATANDTILGSGNQEYNNGVTRWDSSSSDPNETYTLFQNAIGVAPGVPLIWDFTIT